jgi:hypothetical protein
MASDLKSLALEYLILNQLSTATVNISRPGGDQSVDGMASVRRVI